MVLAYQSGSHLKRFGLLAVVQEAEHVPANGLPLCQFYIPKLSHICVVGDYTHGIAVGRLSHYAAVLRRYWWLDGLRVVEILVHGFECSTAHRSPLDAEVGLEAERVEVHY